MLVVEDSEENVEATWRGRVYADDHEGQSRENAKNRENEEVTEKLKEDAVSLVASTPARGVLEEPKTGFTRVAVFSVTLLILSAAWGVVALSIYILMRVLTEQGFSQTDAGLIAAPAVIVPLWKTVSMLRQPSLERVLVGQLWVLNGGIVWGLLVLAAVWWINLIRELVQGGTSGLLLALASAGFIPLVALLYLINSWVLRRWSGK